MRLHYRGRCACRGCLCVPVPRECRDRGTHRRNGRGYGHEAFYETLSTGVPAGECTKQSSEEPLGAKITAIEDKHGQTKTLLNRRCSPELFLRLLSVCICVCSRCSPLDPGEPRRHFLLCDGTLRNLRSIISVSHQRDAHACVSWDRGYETIFTLSDYCLAVSWIILTSYF